MVILTEEFALFDTYMTVAKNAKDISAYVAESIMNIYGIIVKVDLSKYGGMTSKEIAKEVLKENGFNHEEIDIRLDRYMEDLPYSYYNVAWSDTIHITEGAKELLEELEKKGVLLGLATGEAERVAKMRLEKAKLDKYFKFGAFGEVSIKMDEIVKQAVEIADKEYQIPLEQGVFIASSPEAIKAGKIMRMRTVGLATGKYSVDELRAVGADEVIKSLKEKSKILKMLEH